MIFIRLPGSYPRGGTWGAGGLKNCFLNIVMWHIKLKGMISRPINTETFYPIIKLVTSGGVRMLNTIRFLRERGGGGGGGGGVAKAPIKCVQVVVVFEGFFAKIDILIKKLEVGIFKIYIFLIDFILKHNLLLKAKTFPFYI